MEEKLKRLVELEKGLAQFAADYLSEITLDDIKNEPEKVKKKEGIIDLIEKILDLIKKIKGILSPLC